MRKLLKISLWKGQRSKICITVYVSHTYTYETFETHTHTHIMSLTNNIPQNPHNATKHNASHLGVVLPATLVHPPSHSP